MPASNMPDKRPSRCCVTIEVKVKPRSSRAGIEGVSGGMLIVKLTAPPAEGQANEQLVEVLSDEFSIPKSMIRILRGESSRIKLVELQAAPETVSERFPGLK